VIVVTGAKGVIGRAVVAQLSAAGITIKTVVREAFDLSAGNDLTTFLGDPAMAVIHLAAAVPHSLHYPDTDASADVTRRIDHCILNAAQAWGCRVVYASGCSLYDKRSEEMKFEDTPKFVRPDSPYLKAKSEGEERFTALPSHAVMRVPAPIGPGLPATVVARRFFDLASAGQPIPVWGSGTREQNFVDVRDIADVMIKAALTEANGLFNIAADAPVTMLDLAKTTVKVLGCGSIEMAGIPDPLENEYARYSNKRAGEVLGWRPKIMIEDSIRSMREVL